MKFINPESLQIIPKVFVEPSLKSAEVGHSLQFIRKGYYSLDSDSTEEKLVFNRTVTLKDTWAKEKVK
jgi:glutaminyl-tRNA synthetase